MKVTIDPRNMNLDLLDRCVIRDALAHYKQHEASRAARLQRRNAIEAAEDNAARAGDLLARFIRTLQPEDPS